MSEIPVGCLGCRAIGQTREEAAQDQRVALAVSCPNDNAPPKSGASRTAAPLMRVALPEGSSDHEESADRPQKARRRLGDGLEAPVGIVS